MADRVKSKKSNPGQTDSSPEGQSHGARGSDSSSSQQGGKRVSAGRSGSDQPRDDAGHFTDAGRKSPDSPKHGGSNETSSNEEEDEEE